MENLVEKLAKEHGLTVVQASSILNTIVTFTEENYPSKGDNLEAILLASNTTEETNHWQPVTEKITAVNSYPLYTLHKRKAV